MGATLHRGVQASHYRGLSRCGAQAPDVQAQQLWLTGLVAPRHVGSSQTRARTHVPCIGRQILNHCATREALFSILLISLYFSVIIAKDVLIILLCFLLNVGFYIYIYIFMALLGLRFCARALSSWGKRVPLFIAVRGPLTIAASLVAEHRLQTPRLSNCGSRAQSLRGMWDPPRPGPEPVSTTKAGRLSTTAPPGKPRFLHFNNYIFLL